MTIKSDTEYDVVVVGGGMVGSMLAALLAKHSNLKLAVLEHEEPLAFDIGSNPDYDLRVSALSVATQRMFESAGAWQGVMSRRACVYREMLVWDGEELGQTHFKSDDIGEPALGHIVENRVAQLALLDCVKRADNVDYLCPMHLTKYQNDGDRLTLTINTGSETSEVSEERVISTRLLIGADGARSQIRSMADISMHKEAYEHHALVATVETELPQQQITWQRFQPTGPQAFLPLCGNRASMVWYHNADEVRRLKSLDDAEFGEYLMDQFPKRMGTIRAVLGRGSFPIVKAHAQTYIAERLALVGDAAHTVHPLAGQGVNLGMLDAASLAELIADTNKAGVDIGSRRLLRRYERWRRGDNAIMISILDGFYHAFQPQPVALRKIRSASLGLADHTGPLKNAVMRYAMGTGGDLPRFAR